MKRSKKYMLGLLGAGLLALPLAMPSTAQADDFRISLNLGDPAPVYYSRPAPAPVVVKEVYREPVYYRPAPERVVYYRPAPQRVVVREYPHRTVVREVYRPAPYAWNHGWGHGGWGHDRYVAWR